MKPVLKKELAFLSTVLILTILRKGTERIPNAERLCYIDDSLFQTL
jgi:hypothetical protein